MQVTHIVGTTVELVEVVFSLKGLEEYNSDNKLQPVSNEGDDPSGYTFESNGLHDVVIMYDFDGAIEQIFIGPAGSFQH